MSPLAEYDRLISKYIGTINKRLVIKERVSSCTFVKERWGLHVNGRVLISYANKEVAREEHHRLIEKFMTSGIEFRE